jgi:O-antigen/teichoic acid export membrane protein
LRHRIDPRLVRVAMTAAASYLGRFGTGLVVLVTIPMARADLHPELFGVWMMLSALLGFFAFADLGVGNGVLNGVTRASATGDPLAMQRTLGGGYACTTAAAALLLASWATWSLLSEDPTTVAGHLAPGHRGDVRLALDLFVLLLAINIPASLVQKVQLGVQQGHWIGVAQFGAAMVSIAGVPLALHYGLGLPGLVAATLGAQTAGNVIASIVWFLGTPEGRSARWPGSLHAGTAVALLRTGSMFFALQLAAAFAFQSDSIVITHTLGHVAYGDFAVVQRLFLFISMLLSAALLGLWPAFGDAMARGDMTWAWRTLARALATAGSVAAAAAIVLVFAMDGLLGHWLHQPLRPPLLLTLALAGWTVVDAMASVAGAFMNGAGILRAQVLLALVMAGLAFAGKWYATPLLGPAGAVMATLAAYCLVSVPGQIFIFKRLFAARS